MKLILILLLLTLGIIIYQGSEINKLKAKNNNLQNAYTDEVNKSIKFVDQFDCSGQK